MGFKGSLLGGMIGWGFGGPIGAIIGSILGGTVSIKAGRETAGRGRAPASARGSGSSAAAALMVLLAAVTRADNKTTKNEVKYVKEFLVRNFGRENASDLMQIYRKALKHQFDLNDVCRQVRENLDWAGRSELIHTLFGLAAADGATAAELQLVREIGRRLKLSDQEIRGMEAMVHGRGETWSGSATGADPGPAHSNRYYEVLGASREDSMDEIKKKYRELAKKYHPDLVVHLGEEFRLLAKQKFQSIQEAYDAIKESRGVS